MINPMDNVSGCSNNDSSSSELEELKRQCETMAETLQKLKAQENMLQIQNDMIARATVEAGYVPMDVKSWQVKAKKAKAKEKKSTK